MIIAMNASSLTALVLILHAIATSALPTQNAATNFQSFRDEPIEMEEAFLRHLDGLGGGRLLRNLDGLGGGHLLRQTRGFDSLSGGTFGLQKKMGSLSGSTYGQKRNFDEIDRSGFNSFVKKNFDEIDRSGFDSFVKKNFDEIDRSGFGSFVKRSVPSTVIPRYLEIENN